MPGTDGQILTRCGIDHANISGIASGAAPIGTRRFVVTLRKSSRRVEPAVEPQMMVKPTSS
jgi:hypothetical protein